MRKPYDTETFTLPASSVDRYYGLREEAASFGRYLETEKRYDFERALRDGTASTPDKIRAAWEEYGSKASFDKYGPVVRVMAPQVLRPVSFKEEPVLEAIAYEAYDFSREVTRNKDYTVTRVHCGGLTVSETVEETR